MAKLLVHVIAFNNHHNNNCYQLVLALDIRHAVYNIDIIYGKPINNNHTGCHDS